MYRQKHLLLVHPGLSSFLFLRKYDSGWVTKEVICQQSGQKSATWNHNSLGAMTGPSYTMDPPKAEELSQTQTDVT